MSNRSIKSDPILIKAAHGDKIDRSPAWMMRQAGRYQKSFREIGHRYPSFRQRSEKTHLIVEITLQPYKLFKPDGIILFSDILTPLPAFGIEFTVDDKRGPLISKTIQDEAGYKIMKDIDISKVSFVGESLKQLRSEVSLDTTVMGFIGSPWTLATYLVEGCSSATYKTIKNMMSQNPELLDNILSRLAKELLEYAKFQLNSGADTIQIFDSWGGQLSPQRWDLWSFPYLKAVIESIRKDYRRVPLIIYSNGSGGLLEKMGDTGVEVIGLDWSVNVNDARNRIGDKICLQGNIDPLVLLTKPETITEAVLDTLIKAGRIGHILNLGHGVLVGTPEENVLHFFEINRKIHYDKLFRDYVYI